MKTHPRICENPSAKLRKSVENLCKSSQNLAYPLRICAATPSRQSLGGRGWLLAKMGRVNLDETAPDCPTKLDQLNVKF